MSPTAQTPPGTPGPPGPGIRQVMMDAGVWLVFLAFPVLAILRTDASVPLKVLGFAGLAGFAALYLTAFLRPQPLLRRPLWVNTVLYCVGLACLVGLAVPSASYGVLATAPYFAAVWLFTHPLRAGLTGTAVVVVLFGAVGLWWAGPSNLLWSALALGSALLIIVTVRLSIAQEDRARVLREELIVAQQRESLARDVHDVLGHSLTVVTVKTELAQRLVDADPERAKTELAEVLELTRQSLAEVRSTVGGLRTPELGAQLASTRTALDAAGISAHLPTPDTAEQIPAAQRALFAWCLREAVTNVIRHASASRCTVTLEPGRLVVHDDGRGLSGPAVTSQHGPDGEGNGLRGMHERVEQAGGTLVIGPGHAPGQHRTGVPGLAGRHRPGTQVEVTL